MGLASYMDELQRSDVEYKRAFDKLIHCEIEVALPALLSHLKLMDELVCLPWPDYSACQEAVKQCFSIMANCRVT